MKSTKEKKGRRSWTTGEVFKRMDSFGEHLPNFNLKGKDSVNSVLGGIFSLALSLVISMYGLLKFLQLIEKHNPNISFYYEENGMAFGRVLNAHERGFRIALTVESYLKPNHQKNDPKYVKYLFRLTGKRNGKYY